jgi:pimeloyl-ACP methyl ester carboxylesterase
VRVRELTPSVLAVAAWVVAGSRAVAVLFAATYHERTRGLVLADPAVRGTRSKDYPWALDDADRRERIR